MAILDLTLRAGGPEGGPCLKDRAVILAYLEDLLQSGAETRLAVEGHPPISARVAAIQEDPARFRLALEKPLPVTWIRRREIVFLFSLDGIRLLAQVRFLERGGYLEVWFTLPAEVRHADRRGRMRVHFGPREKATVTALEGLLGPRGATGALLDLSMEGLRMRVDRAVTVKGRAQLAVTPSTFPKGTRFPILRIDQLPHAPVLVCAGVVAHVTHTGDHVQMGIRFEELGEMEAQIIHQVMGRRLPTFNASFPHRKRHPHAAGAETATVTVTHHGHRGESAEPGPTRKSGKRILLAVHDDLDRAILASSLRIDGYRKIHEARTLADAQGHLDVFPMDLAILAQDPAGPVVADLLARLRQLGHLKGVPALLLADPVDDHARALAKEAGMDHVLSLDADFGDDLKVLLTKVLGV